VYLEWLRRKVTVAEEMNRKASDEVAVLAETTTRGCCRWLLWVGTSLLVTLVIDAVCYSDMIQLDVDTKALDSSLWKLDSRVALCLCSPVFSSGAFVRGRWNLIWNSVLGFTNYFVYAKSEVDEIIQMFELLIWTICF
jgi:hypothetical protein